MKIKKEAEISMEYISIDIGNGYVKAVNLEGDTLHFPTVLKENRDKNILGEALAKYKSCKCRYITLYRFMCEYLI